MKQTGNNPSVGQYEDKKKRLQQERQREYREMMDKVAPPTNLLSAHHQCVYLLPNILVFSLTN